MSMFTEERIHSEVQDLIIDLRPQSHSIRHTLFFAPTGILLGSHARWFQNAQPTPLRLCSSVRSAYCKSEKRLGTRLLGSNIDLLH